MQKANLDMIIKKNILYLEFNENTNIMYLYVLLKICLIKSPVKILNIYKVMYGMKGSIVKKKQNLNFYKNIRIEDFLEQFTSDDNNIYVSSGDNVFFSINGWEIRYGSAIENDVFFENIEKYVKLYENLYLNETNGNFE